MNAESLKYGGIFREEVAQNLLDRCVLVVQDCFEALHTACAQKIEGEGVYTKCVDSVNSWSEPDFQQECTNAGDAFDTFVRGSFIAYVRHMNLDPTGQNLIEVRLTIPPTVTFMREFLRDLARDPVFRGAEYFKHNRMLQKDVLMKSIRAAFGNLSKEYVYVPPANEVAATNEDVDADDSVSCVSPPVTPPPRESKARKQPPPTETGISVQLRKQPPAADEKSTASRRQAQSAASSSSYRSASTSRSHASKASDAGGKKKTADDDLPF